LVLANLQWAPPPPPTAMPSIAGAGGGRLFSVNGAAAYWGSSRRRLLLLQRSLFSSLAGGGTGDDVTPHLPVVIVGAGPVGLVLSFLLTKFGNPHSAPPGSSRAQLKEILLLWQELHPVDALLSSLSEISQGSSARF
jgi:hypothetical protein